MKFDQDTTIRICGYRGNGGARVVRNLGCVWGWKPSVFTIGGEVWKDGFGLFLGPFMLGFGKICDDQPFSYLPDHLRSN